MSFCFDATKDIGCIILTIESYNFIINKSVFELNGGTVVLRLLQFLTFTYKPSDQKVFKIQETLIDKQ